MKTKINGHDVEFKDAADGRGNFYSLHVDALHIGFFPNFEAMEKRAHSICEHYPSVALPEIAAALDKAKADGLGTDERMAARQAVNVLLCAAIEATPDSRHRTRAAAQLSEAYRLIGVGNWTSLTREIAAFIESENCIDRLGIREKYTRC